MKINAILFLFVLIQSNISAQGLNVDFGGTWEGNWFNTTFQSTGPFYMEIYLNESDMTYKTYTDIGGNVFGGSDPAPNQGQGSYTNTAGVINFESQGWILGPTTFNFDTNTGDINIDAVPGGNITQYLVTGTATSQVWDLDFTLTATWGGAIGTIDLTKTSASTAFLDVDEITNIPNTISLKQNYPNPFNPTTAINFSLPADNHVSLSIYSISGQLVRELVKQSLNNGEYSIIWDGKDDFGNSVSGGVYIYNLQIEGINMTKKMILMK